MNFPQYKEFLENGWSSLCEGVFARGDRRISAEQMHEMLDEKKQAALRRTGDAPDLSNVFAEITWEETHQKAVGEFYTAMIPFLDGLAAGDPDSVRIVFYFDS
jgi:hypothetical protein